MPLLISLSVEFCSLRFYLSIYTKAWLSINDLLPDKRSGNFEFSLIDFISFLYFPPLLSPQFLLSFCIFEILTIHKNFMVLTVFYTLGSLYDLVGGRIYDVELWLSVVAEADFESKQERWVSCTIITQELC